ncbi:MAG: PepSY-associated TM helix domain-containing protein [Acidimicrobiales bacterium]
MLPASAIVDGSVDYLVVSEYVRANNDVRGAISDFETVGDAGSISFKGPGYSADVRLDVSTGNYDVLTTEQGLLGVMNDLQ